MPVLYHTVLCPTFQRRCLLYYANCKFSFKKFLSPLAVSHVATRVDNVLSVPKSVLLYFNVLIFSFLHGTYQFYENIHIGLSIAEIRAFKIFQETRFLTHRLV